MSISHPRPVRLSARAPRGLLLALLVLLALAAPRAVARAAHPGEGGRPLSATLTGAAEVPGPGDPDGSGSAHLRLNPGQGEICYTLAARDIAPATAAHIHAGVAGSAGPVVVPLAPPTGAPSHACATVDRALVIAILQHPERYYVNVHNAEYPAGAVRGQLQ